MAAFSGIRHERRFEALIDRFVRRGMCGTNKQPSRDSSSNASARNRATLERYVAATNARHSVDWYFAPGYRYHGPSGTLDQAQFIRQHDQFLSAFPDVRLTILEVVSSADKTVTRWSAEGTHKGPLMGMPPTQRPVRISGIIITRFVEEMDLLGLLRQLGATP
jgi:predicted ester cyclase